MEIYKRGRKKKKDKTTLAYHLKTCTDYTLLLSESINCLHFRLFSTGLPYSVGTEPIQAF